MLPNTILACVAQPAMYTSVVPVYYDSERVHYKLGDSYRYTDYSGYILMRSQNPCILFFSDSTFPFMVDVIFESLLSPVWRINNMWRSDLLLYWHWETNKSGIQSTYERLLALDQASIHFNILEKAQDGQGTRCSGKDLHP